MRLSDTSQLVYIFFKVDHVVDEVQDLLTRIQSLKLSDPNAKEVIDLKKRKLIEDV